MGEHDPSNSGYPRKRARTRLQLLRAGLEALADTAPSGLTVGSLTAIAGTSQGTFYNHFSSLEELVTDAADHLAQGVEIASETLEVIEHDPAARVAIGTLQLLRAAEDDQVAAAAFVTLTASLPEFRARVRTTVRRAIEDGARVGRFDVGPGEAPVNAVLGTTLQSMRSRNLGEMAADEHDAVVALVLRLLGVPAPEISIVADRARQVVTANPWRPVPAP